MNNPTMSDYFGIGKTNSPIKKPTPYSCKYYNRKTINRNGLCGMCGARIYL